MLLLVSSECSPAALLWGEEPPGSKCPSPSITVFSEAVVVLVAVWLPGCLGVSRGRYHPAAAIFPLEARLDHQGGGYRQSVAPSLSGFHRSLTGVETRVGGSPWLGGPSER